MINSNATATPPKDSNSLLTTAQLAVMLGVSTVSLVNKRSLGTSPVPYRRINRSIYYQYSDVLDYLESIPKIQA